jgi:hypothetical protein
MKVPKEKTVPLPSSTQTTQASIRCALDLRSSVLSKSSDPLILSFSYAGCVLIKIKKNQGITPGTLRGHTNTRALQALCVRRRPHKFSGHLLGQVPPWLWRDPDMHKVLALRSQLRFTFT